MKAMPLFRLARDMPSWPKGPRARWLAYLAILAHLWMPVLHAHHAHASPLNLADLHGELCLADRNDAVPGSPVQGSGEHAVMVCECLTCKLLQAAAGPVTVYPSAPAWETLAVKPLYLGDAQATPSFIRPPGRGPPLI